MASSIPLPDDIAQYFERIASEGDRTGFVRAAPYDYEILVENLLDPSHVPFSHHGTFPGSNRSSGGTVTMEPVLPVTPNAITSVKYTDSSYKVLRSPFLEFVNPAFIKYTYKSRDPEKSNASLIFSLAPVRKGQSLVFAQNIPEGGLSGHRPRMTMAKRLKLAPLLIHVGRNTILDGDNVFLHMQEQNLMKERKTGWTPDAYFTPTSADYMVLRFRNWLRKEGGGGPFGPSDVRETSPISRRELLDRYESYTLKTKDAQKALAFVNRSIALFKIMSNAFLLMGGATVVYSFQKGIGLMWQTVLCLSAFALCLFLQRFLRNKILPLFYFVDYVHADKN